MLSADDTIARWEGIAHTAIRGIFAHGWEKDDLLQEARLGLVQAYAAWDHERPFGPLAYAIARRRVLEVVHGSSAALHMHHVKPWASHPELRMVLDNLVLFCRSCHIEAHRREVRHQ